mgnify:CR=1 FL=1
MAAGLYIHIPFCFSKCPYCDFYSTKYTPTAADAFAEKLGGQMQDYTGSFDTVYFGGGTPSILEPRVLTGILQAVRDHFAIDPAAEITVECNPSKDLTGDMEQYAAAGINRVSIGMQSAVDRERFALGRRAGSGEVARTVAAAKAAGITNISLDVMLGTPKQTPDSLEETFAFIERMQVTHISAYLLKIEPGTPFDRLQAKLALPEEDTVCQMYLQTVERLGQLGFAQYEISNFARPGDESRHNLKYWLLEPYLGLGPSAHSLWNGRRFYFDRDWIWQDEGPGGDREEQILLGLRLNRGIPADWLTRDPAPYIAGGFMRRANGRISLTPRGMLVSNTILAELLD